MAKKKKVTKPKNGIYKLDKGVVIDGIKLRKGTKVLLLNQK